MVSHWFSKVTRAHDLFTPGLTRTVLDTTGPNVVMSDLTFLFALMLRIAASALPTMLLGMPPTHTVRFLMSTSMPAASGSGSAASVTTGPETSTTGASVMMTVPFG